MTEDPFVDHEKYYDKRTDKTFVQLPELGIHNHQCAGCWFDMKVNGGRSCNHITECVTQEFILVDPDDKENMAQYIAARLES